MESERGLMRILGFLTHLEFHVHCIEALHSLSLVTYVEWDQGCIEDFLDSHSGDEEIKSTHEVTRKIRCKFSGGTRNSLYY